MFKLFVLTYLFVPVISANLTNEFVLDYFSYKKPASVAGFTCNNNRGEYEIQNENVSIM